VDIIYCVRYLMYVVFFKLLLSAFHYTGLFEIIFNVSYTVV
jgi:hypothetical protein